MPQFSSYDFAIRFRNVISNVVTDILDRDRPPDKVGRVIDVDRASGYARVIYSGDQSNPVRVKMYPGIQPKRTDKLHGDGGGSIVRVSGPSGARFISQVLDGSNHQISPHLVTPSIAAGGSGETSIRTFFGFSSDSVPVPDDTTPFKIAAFIVPAPFSGIMNVYTLVHGVVGDTCAQHDLIAWDSNHARETDTAATNQIKTNPDIGLTLMYRIDTYPNHIELFFLRSSSSMNESTGMTIHVDCFGINAELEEVGENIR